MEMTITFPGDKGVNADFNGFTVATDQPREGGGEGAAPSPFDYFCSSARRLGCGCFAIEVNGMGGPVTG
jgi:uncharacterized OsmC-like protein